MSAARYKLEAEKETYGFKSNSEAEKETYGFKSSSEAEKETYGFKSRNSPPQINDLIPFEEGMAKLIQNIKFKDTKCSFQGQLNNDIKDKIKGLNTTRTTNFYEMSPNSTHKKVSDEFLVD